MKYLHFKILFVIVASKVLEENITLKSIEEFDVAELAKKFMEGGIITKDEMEEIAKDKKNFRTNKFRKIRLCKELIKRTVSSKGIFLWFIRTLKEYDTVESQKLARTLEEKYKEVNIMIILALNLFFPTEVPSKTIETFFKQDRPS